MIVVNSLTRNASDQGIMLGLVDQVQQSLQAQPDRRLEDAGYRKEEDFLAVERRGVEGSVSVRREGKDAGEIDAEAYPATRPTVEKLSSPDGREVCRERKHIPESVNSWIKQVLGFRLFSVGGLRQADGEWDLSFLAVNMRRMKPLIQFE